MYTFDIEECRLTLPPQISEDFDLSQIMYEVPISIVKAGTVERGSIPEFIRFYNAMLSGEPHGYFEVKKRKKDGTCCWYSAKYSMIYDKRIRFVFFIRHILIRKSENQACSMTPADYLSPFSNVLYGISFVLLTLSKGRTYRLEG